MAGFSDQIEADTLNLYLASKNLSTDLAVASTTISGLWVGLHTADPGDTGTQGVSEGGYGQYTRIQTTRSTAGWSASTASGQASPVANIDFPQNTSTSTGTFTHASIGLTSASTAGKVLASGTLSPTINFSQNVTPRLTTGSSFTLD